MNEQNIQVGDYVLCIAPVTQSYKYTIQQAIPNWVEGTILRVDKVLDDALHLEGSQDVANYGDPWFDFDRFEKVNPFVVAVRTINQEHERDQTWG